MNNGHTCKCGSCEKPEAERDAREAYIALVHTLALAFGKPEPYCQKDAYPDSPACKEPTP
jgi:hypothetical protein